MVALPVEQLQSNQRIALATPVRLSNGVEGVIRQYHSCDPNRYEVCWFSRHFYAVRTRWVSVQQFVVLG